MYIYIHIYIYIILSIYIYIYRFESMLSLTSYDIRNCSTSYRNRRGPLLGYRANHDVQQAGATPRIPKWLACPGWRANQDMLIFPGWYFGQICMSWLARFPGWDFRQICMSWLARQSGHADFPRMGFRQICMSGLARQSGHADLFPHTFCSSGPVAQRAKSRTAKLC